MIRKTIDKNFNIFLFLTALILSYCFYRVFPEKISFFLLEPASISSSLALLKDFQDNRVWLVKDGKRRWLPDANLFNEYGLSWSRVKTVPASEMEKYPLVKVVKGEGKEEVYYLMESGHKYHLRSPEIFESYGFSWNEIEEVSPKEITVYPETNLIRLSMSGDVYKVEDEKKRLIKSPEVFEKSGYDWENVFAITDEDFEGYEEGKDIKSALWLEPKKKDYRPLEEVKFHFWLSSSERLFANIFDGEGKNYYSKKYELPLEEGEFVFRVGGTLGLQKIGLEVEGGEIVDELSFLVKGETYINTSSDELNIFYPRVKNWMEDDIFYCQGAKGYRSPDTRALWIRDHTHQIKGFKYWEEDMKSVIDWFIGTQRADGSFYDYCPGRRMEVEADVEYLAVIALYQSWQATGDDEWMFGKLEALEKGLNYSMNAWHRWADVHRLVKRPFTLDTWDFQWGDGASGITSNTAFGILSGDNSGMYEGTRLLSKMFDYRGDLERTRYWRGVAEGLRERANNYLWDNERGYYRNFLHLDGPNPSVGIDEREILSLSNVYNINRGDFASHEQIRKIIRAYQSRAGVLWKGERVFEEWFSVQPDYGENKWGTPAADQSGEYVNGGIMPLVGGELANAAFEHGFEKYGLEELLEYINLTNNNETYLWYWPNGLPHRGYETVSTDGWGSSAFLNAFVEGLVGIKDLNKLYDSVRVSPRWTAGSIEEARALIKYGASDGYFSYIFENDLAKSELKMTFSGSGNKAYFHILLPEDKTRALSAEVNGERISFNNTRIENSYYIDFEVNLAGVRELAISY